MKLCLNCIEAFDKEYDVCPFCGYVHGSKASNNSHLQPGTLINERYVIGTAIGQGGFGITYKGWDKKLKQKVAIKEYYPTAFASRVPDQTEVTAISSATEKSFNSGVSKFISEARIIAALNDQQGIVHVYDYLSANNTAYIVMEHIDGKSVKDVLKENNEGYMNVDSAMDIIIPVLKALDKVHSKGTVHRDISPDNIMISEDGQVKLIDFGAARNVDPEERQRLSVVLKASYAPPEQYGSSTVQNASTDIYALGAVLYRLITGKMPEQSRERVNKDRLKRPSEIKKSIPKWLDVVIIKSLSLDPKDRFQSAVEFIEAIEKGKSGELLLQKEKDKKTTRKIIIVFITFIAVLIASMFFFMGNSKSQIQDSIQIVESGYQYDENTGDIHAAFIMNNLSEDVINATINVVAYNENNDEIGSDSRQLEYPIYLQSEIGATCAFYEVCDEVPARVEFIVSSITVEEHLQKNVKEHGFVYPEVNMVYQNGDYYQVEITNSNTYNCYGPITVLFRDDNGSLIGGETVWAVDGGGIDVPSNTTITYNIQVYDRLSDNCELYMPGRDITI